MLLNSLPLHPWPLGRRQLPENAWEMHDIAPPRLQPYTRRMQLNTQRGGMLRHPYGIAAEVSECNVVSRRAKSRQTTAQPFPSLRKRLKPNPRAGLRHVLGLGRNFARQPSNSAAKPCLRRCRFEDLYWCPENVTKWHQIGLLG